MYLSNWKTHVIALCVIVSLIIGLSLLFGNGLAKRGGGASESENGIIVISASYGQNCIPLIERQNARNRAEGKGKPIAMPQKNNVYDTVSGWCGGRSVCNFVVTPEEFPIDPYSKCMKELEVSYRCFSFDRPWRATAKDRSQLSIDCSNRTKE